MLVSRKAYGLKDIHEPVRLFAEAGSHSSPKLQGYPDEGDESALTSNQWS